MNRTVLGLALVVGACSSSGGSGGGAAAESIFVVPQSLSDLTDTHFYDHPWPSDLRRDASGAIVLDGLYDPSHIELLEAYLGGVKGLIMGFSPVAMGYVRFTVDLDPATLPSSPTDTLSATSNVQLIDVDPSSPEHGQRKLAQTFWRQDDGTYWMKDTLAVGPALGSPLRGNTKYAIVVTTGVKSADGRAIAPSSDLKEVLGLSTPSARTQAAHDLYAPAVADLDAMGVHPAGIAQLAVFTTNDPTAELFQIADDVHANVPAPTIDATKWQKTDQAAHYDVYEGVYGPAPNYQEGTPPYEHDGGDFVFQNGKPVLQNTFTMRFTFVVPKAADCPMPAGGYPMVLYAHGTGGNYRSIVDEGGSVGDAVTQRCLAAMGVDQIFHGIRPGAPALDDPNAETKIELDFFNFNNPKAMRTNTRQGAIDVVQQARLFTDSHVSIPASVSRTGTAITFDASKLVFYGHSQGGLNGPLFLAADKTVRGGVLSGSSAGVPITLTEKTLPTPSVAALVQALLGLTSTEDQAELNLFHPVLSFTQTVIDPIDPTPYLGYIVRHPRDGFAPKSIFQTEGIGADGVGDSYAPPHGIEVSATAIGLPLQTPDVRPIAEMTWAGIPSVTIPAGGLQGNLANGQASGVLAQFAPPPGSDGHFVVFDVPAARNQAADFCKNLADDPKGKVPAPGN